MANLKFPDKKLLEDLLEMGGGYVLDFSDREFSTFFRDYHIDIDSAKYHQPYGSSKAKRMRSFWEREPDSVVGKVLEGMFQLIDDAKISPNHRQIVSRLLGKAANENPETEGEFLEKSFGKIELAPLQLGAVMEKTLICRMDEIEICIKGGAWLSVVILCGSSIEGILLDMATKNPKKFNESKSSPKDSSGKVKPFQKWNLNDLINVAHDSSFIGLDVKKFSHALRDFRNFIHPYEQTLYKFNPDEHTAKISLQVLQAVLADLTDKRKNQ